MSRTCRRSSPGYLARLRKVAEQLFPPRQVIVRKPKPKTRGGGR